MAAINLFKQLLTIILLAFISLFSQYLSAQITITGNVRSSANGEFLNGASVTLHKTGNDNILGYSISSQRGTYKIVIAARPDSLDLCISFLGYAAQTKKIAPQSQTINFLMDEQEIKIREVRVSAPKIRRNSDTIIYNATQFAREKDRTLVDMLERLPGVEVNKETGSIQYQGKSINRFYVENQNLMDGRYGEISKNMPVGAVKSVEVFENHQPIRALQDISFTDKAAMNIKLKDKSKGRWIGNGITAGSGFYPILWKAELSAMKFSAKTQTYITYKTNNTGQNVTIYNLFAGIYFISTETFNGNAFYSPFIASPDLENKRSLFNKTHVASLNNLWKTGEKSNLRFNLDYKNDEQKQNSSQSTSYFINNDSSYVFKEKNQVVSRTNELKGNLTFTQNSQKTFLENKFSTNAEWQNITTDLETNGHIQQKLKLPSLEISDNLKMIKRTKTNKTYHLTSNNKYSQMPQNLKSNITGTTNFENINQTANIKSFKSENVFAFGHFVKNVNINYMFSHDFLHNRYDTGKEIYRETRNTTKFTPTLSWRENDWEATVAAPVSYINFEENSSKDNVSKIIFNPSIRVKYSINFYWEAQLYGNISNDFCSLYDLVSDVMKNYRTCYIFEGSVENGKFISTGLDINYKNNIKALFAYLKISYGRNRNKNMPEQIVEQSLITNKIIGGKNNSNNINVNGRISKIFDWKRCSAHFNWNISRSHAEILRKSTTTPFINFAYSINPSFEIETFGNQMLTYSVEFTASRTKIDEKKYPFMRNMKQNFVYYAPIAKGINVSVAGEFLRNQINDKNHKSMFLMDVIVRYKATPKLEFTLTCNNIFNTREYSYSYYNDLQYNSYSYNLRPLNIIFSANISLR